MRSLPEEYQKEAIIAVLSGKKIHNPRKRRSPLAEQKAQLVSNLEAKQNQGRGHYYDLSIQNQITKQQAKALLYYQQHGFSSIDDFDAFSDFAADAKKRRDELSAKITSAEKRMNEIAVLQKHITNYLKTKDVYAGYRKSGYSKQYYEEHETRSSSAKLQKAHLTSCSHLPILQKRQTVTRRSFRHSRSCGQSTQSCFLRKRQHMRNTIKSKTSTVSC